jgi:uncharacterized membrane protein
MTTFVQRLRIGQRVAPPRFIVFCVLFVIGIPALYGPLGLGRATLAAFDIASLVFLALIATLLGKGEASQMRETSRRNDANRVLLLVVTGVTMLVILVAVYKELQGKSDVIAIALVIATLALAWLFSNVVYALHYAHLYYLGDEHGKDLRGLQFSNCDEPDWWDFLYFSFTIGMTFQTSDTAIGSRRLRRIATGHGLAAFVFNLGILAFTINTLGGGH